MGVLTEFGAIEYKSRKTFHGVLWFSKPDAENPAISRRDPAAIQKTDAERVEVFAQFEHWLKGFGDRCIFVSDNPAYDFQWINHGFWTTIGRNPFGHSGRRISDFYAGLCGDFYKTQQWKRLRVTTHDHNPVNDAMGNVEAFERLMKGER
jgi:hypothetical protein